MTALLAGWGLIVIGTKNAVGKFQATLASSNERHEKILERDRRGLELVGKLKLLTEEEAETLLYLKHNGYNEFRAYYDDTALSALRKMGILQVHETTGDWEARFTVHPSVWEHINIPAEIQAKLGRIKTPPWIKRSNEGRV